jgi:hypothetical protein
MRWTSPGHLEKIPNMDDLHKTVFSLIKSVKINDATTMLQSQPVDVAYQIITDLAANGVL